MFDSTTLRSKHSRFIYKSFDFEERIDSINLHFFYLLEPDISFSHTVSIEIPEIFQGKKINPAELKSAIFHIGMIELFSYWKTATPKNIGIVAGFLDEKQCDWFHKLLIAGMGEFFYRNNIDFTQPNFVNFSSQGSQKYGVYEKEIEHRFLIPIGGGKDSLVTQQVLAEQSIDYMSLLINPTPAMQKAAIVHNKPAVIVKRIFDPKLFELNKKGYLNGHVPFSASVAFISVLIGAVFDFDTVLVSNERSSNEGNVSFKEVEINHQYSKTFAFEKDFFNYSKEFVVKNAAYRSFLRPLYELQISRIFANFHQFFPIFKSCNVGRGDRWCGNCPKCLFAYLSLLPWVSESELKKIFGSNVGENESNKKLLDELVGKTGVKPFECVGTREEVIVALYLGIEKYQQENKHLLPLFIYAQETISSKEKDLQDRSQKLLNSWNDEHNLPESLSLLVRKYTKYESI